MLTLYLITCGPINVFFLFVPSRKEYLHPNHKQKEISTLLTSATYLLFVTCRTDSTFLGGQKREIKYMPYLISRSYIW